MQLTRSIKAGSTDVSVVIRIIDSADGSPETAVTNATSGLDLKYRREGAANVDITEVALGTPALTDAHSDGGILHIGNGYYRLDLPDAAVAAGAAGVLVHGTVTGMIVIGCYVALVAHDPYDGVRLGLTALPNAAAEAAGGLFTRGTGAGQINQDANGRIDSRVATMASDTVTAAALATDAVTEIQSGLATAAALDAVDNFVDTEIAALQTDLTTLLGRLTSTRAGYLDNLQDSRQGLCSYGVLDAGGAGSFTLPSGQRANVAAGDAIYIPGKGARIIASGYNTSTGAGTTVSNFDAAAATSDAYVVFKLPKSEPLTSADLTDGLFTSAKFADAFLTAAKLATDAITAAKVAADAVAEIQSGLATAAALTVVDDFLDTEIAAIKAKTDNLPAAPAAVSDIPTAAAVADAVWDEAIAGHVAAGSTGEALTAAGSAGDPWATAIPGAYGAGSAGNILGNQVPAIKAKTDGLPADPADASDITASFASIASTLSTIAAYIDTEVAAIKAKTDNLPTTPADEATLTTIAANITTLLGADVAYKRGVAVTAFMFAMKLTAGTPATGATVTVQVSKDGGAFANVTAGSGVATEVGSGWYKIDLSGTEMTADEVALKATATGCQQLDLKIRTQS
ncbi:MAG: hypothetical protein IT352_07470 [Gemmatimonadales bacterium]|nr:hypothetical protein [Gemmatimonadales bacterium]